MASPHPILGATSCDPLVSGSPYGVMVGPEMCSRLRVLTPTSLDITVRLRLRQLRRLLPFLFVFGKIGSTTLVVSWFRRGVGFLISAFKFSVDLQLASSARASSVWTVKYSWLLGAMVLFYLAMSENTCDVVDDAAVLEMVSAVKCQGPFTLCWAFSARQAALSHPCSAVLELHAVLSGFNSTAPIPYWIVKYRVSTGGGRLLLYLDMSENTGGGSCVGL